MALEKSLAKVRQLAEPLAHTMGLEVLLVEGVSGRGRSTLRIYLDRPDDPSGVSVDDCSNFSRALDPILDVEGDIVGEYNLEISSPGLNRPLVKQGHFDRQLGNIIQVGIRDDIEGRHNFKGELKEVKVNEGEVTLTIEVDGKNYQLPLDQIKKANLDYFATEEKQNQKK